MTEGYHRKTDSNNEKALGNFLDNHFYSAASEIESFERVTDKERQWKGIDVISDIGGHEYKIDEKAAFNYADTSLSTFAFELSWMSSGEHREGWFLNSNLETELYAICWLKTISPGTYGRYPSYRESDFSIVELMLINKRSLKDHLAVEYGWDDDKLVSRDSEIRNAGHRGKTLTGSDKFSFFYTSRLREKPINFLIKKDVLRDAADGIYEISPDGTRNIKSFYS